MIDEVVETVETVTEKYKVFNESTLDLIIDDLTQKLYDTIRSVTGIITGFIDKAFDKVEEIADTVTGIIDNVLS